MTLSIPLVSVLMPVYNCAKLAGPTVKSIFRQTLNEFELVVVDDGSTDGTPETVELAAGGDNRLRLVKAEHKGLIPALNLGLDHCRGEFIARMDGDDICHPERLRLQVEFMQANPDVSVCSSSVRSFPNHAIRDGFKLYEKWLNSLATHEDISRDIFVESPVAHPSVMLRTTELKGLGGYQEHGWPEDYDLWLRYFVSGKRFAKVPKTLLFWRAHESRLTFTDSRYALENFMRAKAHYFTKWLKPRHQQVIVWGAGMTGRRLSKHLVREGLEVSYAVDVDPKKIGRTMRGIPIISLDDLEKHRDLFIIAAVGSSSARELIREYLKSTGRCETVDFVYAS